ncbi:MAG: 8-amino-7-oxononanoate synthase [Fluviicola sp. XM-24bin1]|nr:MAG: 8-amino-7-oxononanoate synthase [Fluviicola sp. XM-24bin1]
MDAKLHKKLSERQEKGTLRSLSSFEGFVDFFSNDYLGASKFGSLQLSASGSTGSRLLSGNSEAYERLEKQFADFFRSKAALHFNSGYDANLGIFSTIPQKGDTILYDELIHASVRDGVRLSWAKSFSFRHNDLKHLEERLKKTEGAVYVAVEALYSMDGDLAPLEEIAALCERYEAYLIVDEAHSGGIFGETGRGLVDQLGLNESVFVRLITFGKAYGSHGALVLCDDDTRQFLINFCRSFIYSTSLPVSAVEHNYRVASNPELDQGRTRLQIMLRGFCERLGEMKTISDPNSPIQILEIGEVDKTRVLAEKLQASKIAVKPIYSPTVPDGKERLRICLHAYNTSEEIDRLITLLN